MASLLAMTMGPILRSSPVKACNVNFLTLNRTLATSAVKLSENLPQQQPTSTEEKPASKPHENGEKL